MQPFFFLLASRRTSQPSRSKQLFESRWKMIGQSLRPRLFDISRSVYRVYRGTREERWLGQDMARRYGHLSGLLARETRRQEAWRAYMHASARVSLQVADCVSGRVGRAAPVRNYPEARSAPPFLPVHPKSKLLYYHESILTCETRELCKP